MAALADGPKHGYAVAKAVREGSGGRLKLGEGQLYPALYDLEAQGWATAEWDAENADRRVYRLTDEGRAELARRAAKWHEFASAVAGVLPAPEGAR